MYFTRLPDHTVPGFDEQLHFSNFKKHNIIFKAQSNYAFCDNHIGCLSFKTILSGEEWYGIDNHRLAVRPGQFLILNDDQTYSCRIDNDQKVRTLSVFFKKDFASSVFHDALQGEKSLLDDPFNGGDHKLEFFQTLYNMRPELQRQLSNLIIALDSIGYNSCMMDEYLVFLLHYLIRVYKSEGNFTKNVVAVKSNTRTEIFRRLCIAKDMLHSCYMDNPDLETLSNAACLSVPQLVRQFKSVFHTTPHQYLMQIRLRHAADLLKLTLKPVNEITWMCGFENVSAFCRAFKSEYKVQPASYRKMTS